MDFGIARVAGTEHLTTDGYMMGTPAYMAPEQVLGERGRRPRRPLFDRRRAVPAADRATCRSRPTPPSPWRRSRSRIRRRRCASSGPSSRRGVRTSSTARWPSRPTNDFRQPTSSGQRSGTPARPSQTSARRRPWRRQLTWHVRHGRDGASQCHDHSGDGRSERHFRSRSSPSRTPSCCRACRSCRSAAAVSDGAWTRTAAGVARPCARPDRRARHRGHMDASPARRDGSRNSGHAGVGRGGDITAGTCAGCRERQT